MSKHTSLESTFRSPNDSRCARSASLGLALALVLAGCTDNTDYDFAAGIADQAADTAAASPPQALFDPGRSVIPFPNSVLFLGSEDGTLNAPVEDPDDLSDPTVALNQMDGFSTISPIVTPLSEPVDPASVVLGDTVRMFEVTTAETGAVTGIVSELGATQAVATVDGSNLVILPVQPLSPSTDFLVLVTNGVTDNDDQALQPSLSYRLLTGDTALSGPAVDLEPLRLATGAMLTAAAGAGVDASSVVLSWTFKTVSTREVLQAVKDTTTDRALTVADSGFTTADFDTPAGEALAGKADVYVGTLELPYYQSALGDDGNPLPVLNGFWTDADGNLLSRFNPLPTVRSTETVPVLLTVPNDTAADSNQPAVGWPVVIFQHGIRRSRKDVLLLADAFADAGLAVIAIDQPLHGITDTEDPLHAGQNDFPDERERTFAIDVVDNATGAAGADGVPDASGTHYYNLSNLPNTRDNVRQGIADLFVLSASLAGLEGAPIDATRKTFVGQSLGGIVGTVFLSYDDSISTTTLASPGSGVIGIIANSASFGPAAIAALEAAGVPEGSEEFQRFLIVAQTVLDPVDPVNHASALAARNAAIHLIEVQGDTTIRNSVDGSPLVGTTPLARLLGLELTDTSTGGSAWFRFNQGGHRSFLDPGPSPAVTAEMQAQAAAFADSNGTALPVSEAGQELLVAP